MCVGMLGRAEGRMQSDCGAAGGTISEGVSMAVVRPLRRKWDWALIKRLDGRDDGRRRNAHWPEPPTASNRVGLFEGRQRLRRIRVMIDHDLTREGPSSAPLDPAGLLSSLLRSELVEQFQYADDGPPPDVPVMHDNPLVREGWIVVSERQDQDTRGAYFGDASGFTLAGIFGNAELVAAQDVSSDAYSDLDGATAAARRSADALAAGAASQALGADLYVTERPYLHAASWQPGRGTTICRVEEAIALLGLYFRTQDHFPIFDKFSFNRGLFFWVGTREVLPESWRWFTACVKSSHAGAEDGSLDGLAGGSLDLLAGSLLQRVQRSLRARDAVHVALSHPQNNDTQDEALAELDSVLLHLMGAVDVAARVAHRVLRLDMPEYKAAWQNDKWVTAVRARNESLADVVSRGSTNERALTVLRLLRNSVHGQALQGIAVNRSGAPLENLVALPAADEVHLIEAMDALGGRLEWGAKPVPPGRVHLDPGVLADQVVRSCLTLLNDLMAATPVESLPGVALTQADLAPPSSPTGGMTPGGLFTASEFDPWVRASVRWQLGL
jgi:hypothetical protein